MHHSLILTIITLWLALASAMAVLTPSQLTEVVAATAEPTASIEGVTSNIATPTSEANLSKLPRSLNQTCGLSAIELPKSNTNCELGYLCSPSSYDSSVTVCAERLNGYKKPCGPTSAPVGTHGFGCKRGFACEDGVCVRPKANWGEPCKGNIQPYIECADDLLKCSFDIPSSNGLGICRIWSKLGGVCGDDISMPVCDDALECHNGVCELEGPSPR
ncbi:hypothetical protein BCR33DRAFT_714879 [Rhizoclosmatium globosum]|uniref:IGFBP N-terminal domain-containing protein n=1 Tax=Rhizoclosmatium globosum TaxID=329046 RepID=A0A1Y2CLC3_9FUNG|nr:hypothetical protein BCR33DRAFT_714879 [Rhizoclosmatium globosum]|eukprot:ORY47822.1 hypothetical protein BCR33DRAFT_714879 [Rhizoclosmatium globosum]